MENIIDNKVFDSVEKFVTNLKNNNIEVKGRRNMRVTSMIIEIPVDDTFATILVFTRQSQICTIQPIIIVNEHCEIFNKKYINGYIITDLNEFFNDVMTYMNSINKEEA